MLWFIIIIAILIFLAAFSSQNNEKIKRKNQEIPQYDERIKALQEAFAKIKKRCDYLEQFEKYKEIKDAHVEAEKILKKAQKAKEEAILYENTAKAMKNIISGYGNNYIIPSQTLIDGLADKYGYTEVSREYKKIRSQFRNMIKIAEDKYAQNPKIQHIANLILDAFCEKTNNIIANAKTDNFGTLQQKIIDAFNIIQFNSKESLNLTIGKDFLNIRLKELRLACTLTEIHKRDIEEQRHIKEQIREEEKAKREIEKAIKDAAKEEEMLQKAMEKARAQLEKANAEQKIAYEAKIAELEIKWKEAEERNKRALSMAQQTKSGHVYIISNEGSFGKDIYKIGMTRRLEPLDRIKELSSASVPFPFDVHAMIWSENAPALENMLHKKFALFQVNKVNFRKEFFKIPLSNIRTELENENIEVKWTMTAKSSEYYETIAIEKNIKDNPQALENWLNNQNEAEIETDEIESEFL